MSIEKIKNHLKDYKERYIIGGICLVTGAGITVLIMRGVASQHISRGSAVTATRGIAVSGKNVVMNNVSYISSNRKGAPSWVVRCLETDQVFTSQRAAALGMDLVESELSKHLNGVRDHVNGYHFERICMAA